jgi:hypothetical protein
MNLTSKIEKYKVKFNNNPELVSRLGKKLNLTFSDYLEFHELKTLASARGNISFEEGTLIYKLLGNSSNEFNRQPIEVRWVLTRFYKKLKRK